MLKYWAAARRFFFVIGLINSAAAVNALPLSRFLPDAVINELLTAETMTRNIYGGGELTLIPGYETLANRVREQMAAVNPNVTVESLRLYAKPETAKTDNWSGAERAGLYNSILALKSLAGIEYFSRTRGRMHKLYETSGIIDSPDAKKPLPDPVYSSPPPELHLYVRQKDTTFGDNLYKYGYYTDTASFIITQRNINLITLGPLPVIGKDNLCSCAAIFDAGPYLLVYLASFAKVSMLPGIKQQVTASINNRAEALLAWFIRRADAAYRQQGEP